MRAEQCSVIVGQLGPFGLSAQDGELLAEHDNFEVLRASGAYAEARQRCEETGEDAKHEDPGCWAPCLVSTHDRTSSTQRVEAASDRVITESADVQDN